MQEGALRACLLACSLALLGLGPSRAMADEPTATLEVTHDEAGARCADREDLTLRVAARLGRDPFVDGAPFRVHVHATRTGRRYVVTLELFDAAHASLGMREWNEARCDGALREEIALALTLLLTNAPEPATESVPATESEVVAESVTESESVAEGESVAESESVTESVTETESVSEKPRVVVPQVVAQRVEEPGIPVHFEIAAFGAAVLEAAPLPTLGLGVDLGLRIGDVVSLGLEGRFDLPSTGSAAFGGQVETSIVYGGAYACARYVFIGGCIVGGGGALRATGIGYASASTATTAYATIGARVFAELVYGPFVAHLRFDVLPALVRTSLEVSGDTVWSLPPVSFALGGGLGAIF